MTGMGGVSDDLVCSTLTSPVVTIQVFSFRHHGPAIQHCDGGGQDALTGAVRETCQGLGRQMNIFQPPQEVLLCQGRSSEISSHWKLKAGEQLDWSLSLVTSIVGLVCR